MLYILLMFLIEQKLDQTQVVGSIKHTLQTFSCIRQEFQVF